MVSGRYNTASAFCSVVVGGSYNCASATGSFVGAGCVNSSGGAYSVIGGGARNAVGSYSCFSSVLGGRCNRVCTTSNPFSSIYSVIAGGRYNLIGSSCCSFIGSGCYNRVVGPSDHTSSIVGGRYNRICFGNGCNFIGGGVYNLVCGSTRSNIIGGCSNSVKGGNNSTIGTGAFNTICNGTGNFIGGSSRTISYTNYLACFNTIAKTAGSFNIAHPDPAKTATKSLVHSFVESPTAGDNIYRFTIKTMGCEATLKLPDYYKHLNEDTQVFITPKNNHGVAYGIVDESQDNVNIKSNVEGDFNVLIIGTRKDKDAKNFWKGVEVYKPNN